MTQNTGDIPVDLLDGEVVAALYFEDQRPLVGAAALLDWRLNGVLTEMLVDGQCFGRAGEHLMVANNGKLGSDWILFAGGGNSSGLTAESYKRLINHLLETCRRAGFRRVAMGLSPLPDLDRAAIEQMVSDLAARFKDPGFEFLLSVVQQ